MVLKICGIRILWLTVSYTADKSPKCSSDKHAILVAILDVLSEVQELDGA